MGIIIIYVIGAIIAYLMLKIDHISEGNEYTIGDLMINLAFSLASVFMVAFLLFATWFKKIGATGYWNKPVKSKSE